MQNSNWSLCARLLEDPTLVIVSYKPFPQPEYSVFDVSDPDQLPEFVADVLISPGFPHFPFGNEVEPDQF